MRLIETAFDGITKGLAIARGADITLPNIRGRDVDLNGPPFTGPGRVEKNVSWDGKWLGLFGKTLDVGRVTLVLEAAEATNPNVVDQMREDPNSPVSLRLVVYDEQVRHRFERYLQRPRKKRLAELEKFKTQVLGGEPPAIADLITRPLIRDVNAPQAARIAKGWLYLNRFTERYCPQDPQLDAAGGQWLVPICLVYTDGSGGSVGELQIDVKTGLVVGHTPVEQFQERAVALAESIFHG